jgi:hypothetical protein
MKDRGLRCMLATLDLVLPVERPWPLPADVQPEDRPRVAMPIACAFRDEAQRWEQQALQLAPNQEGAAESCPRARPSLPAPVCP